MDRIYIYITYQHYIYIHIHTYPSSYSPHKNLQSPWHQLRYWRNIIYWIKWTCSCLLKLLFWGHSRGRISHGLKHVRVYSWIWAGLRPKKYNTRNFRNRENTIVKSNIALRYLEQTQVFGLCRSPITFGIVDWSRQTCGSLVLKWYQSDT